jgi:hypothetical protein
MKGAMKKTWFLKILPICGLLIAVLLILSESAQSQSMIRDTLRPAISNVTTSNITPTSVTVSWTTDGPSDTNILVKNILIENIVIVFLI